MDTLREQVMINQFVLVAGCSHEQAKQLLNSNNWHFQRALSIFFQEASNEGFHQNGRLYPLTTPANTPATPPYFPETLLAFSKLSTSSKVNKSTTSTSNNNNNNNIFNNNNNNNSNNNNNNITSNINNNSTQHHLQYHPHHGHQVEKTIDDHNSSFEESDSTTIAVSTSPIPTFSVDGTGINSSQEIGATIQR